MRFETRDVSDVHRTFRARARGFTGSVHYRFPESNVDGKFRGYPTDVYPNQGQSRKGKRQRATRVNQWPIDAIVCEDGNPVEFSQAINAVVSPGCKLRGLLSARAPN